MGTKPLHFLLDSKEKYQSRTHSLPTKLGQQPTSKTTSSEKTLGSAVDRSAVNVKTKQNKLGVLICQNMKCSHNKKDWCQNYETRIMQCREIQIGKSVAEV